MRADRWTWGWLLAAAPLLAALAQCARPGEPPSELHPRDEGATLFPRWRIVRGDTSAASAASSPRLPDLRTLWISGDGSRGWIAGAANTLLWWNGNRWEPRRVPGADGTDWAGMAFDPDGENGWLVGSHGATARYVNGRWERRPSPATADLAAVWISPSGGEALAVGTAGTVLRLRDDRWELVPPAGGARRDWHGVCVDPGRERVWLKPAGTGLFTLPLGNLRAFPARPPGALREYQVYTVACGERGGMWAAGVHTAESPGVFHLVQVLGDSIGGRVTLRAVPTAMWSAGNGLSGVIFTHAESDTRILPAWSYVVQGGVAHYTQFPAAVSVTVVWMDETGAAGWAIGPAGLVARAMPERLPPPVVERGSASFTQLSGEFSVRLPSNPRALLGGIALVAGRRDPVVLTPGTHYTVTKGPDRVRVRFTDQARGPAKVLEHEVVALRLEIVYPTISTPPYPVSYETDTFYLAGLSRFWYVAFGIVFVLLLNVAIVVAATRRPLFRHIAYSKVWSHLVGLIVGKYVVIDPLSIYIPWIRDGLFRDYRRALPTAHPAFNRWSATRYIDPDLASLDQGSIAAPNRGWREAYDAAYASRFPGMFLVIGPSGVGKSALAEQLIRFGTERGHTVFLIRLGTSAGIETEVRTLMRQYGGFPADPPPLWERGRFVFILDGLNEDRHVDETESFVRAASSHHLVVATAQEAPAWTANLSVNRIELRPFGAIQLTQVLPAPAVEEIEAHPDLLEWARLPQSAFLLNSYYAVHQKLPDLQAELYLSLRDRLGNEALALRLEIQAWKMFVSHDRQFSPDNTLARDDLEGAVDAGILTHRMESGEDRYRFAHDRVHRFFVAAYRLRQAPQPLDKLREEVGTADPVRWLHVVEFWGELVALEERDGRRPRGSHASFVRQARGFGDWADAVLARQARTLIDRGIITDAEPPVAAEVEPVKEADPT